MSEIRINPPAHVAIAPTQRDAGRSPRRDPRGDSEGEARRETLSDLLHEHAVVAPDPDALVVELLRATDPEASDATWVRIRDAHSGATLLEVTAEVFAAAAAAHGLTEGLLVERNS